MRIVASSIRGSAPPPSRHRTVALAGAALPAPGVMCRQRFDTPWTRMHVWMCTCVLYVYLCIHLIEWMIVRVRVTVVPLCRHIDHIHTHTTAAAGGSVARGGGAVDGGLPDGEARAGHSSQREHVAVTAALGSQLPPHIPLATHRMARSVCSAIVSPPSTQRLL